jgi:hypothetical protein
MDRLGAAVAPLGLGELSLYDVKRRHVELFGATRDGVRVEVRAHFDGTLRDVVAAPSEAARAGLDAMLSPAARRLVAEQGVSAIEEIKWRTDHMEAVGSDASGFRTRVRLTAAGDALAPYFGPRGGGPRGGGPRASGPRGGGFFASIPSEAEARTIVERAGLEWRGGYATGPRHAEAEAINPHGERVRLHINDRGQITRERAIR